MTFHCRISAVGMKYFEWVSCASRGLSGRYWLVEHLILHFLCGSVCSPCTSMPLADTGLEPCRYEVALFAMTVGGVEMVPIAVRAFLVMPAHPNLFDDLD